MSLVLFQPMSYSHGVLCPGPNGKGSEMWLGGCLEPGTSSPPPPCLTLLHFSHRDYSRKLNFATSVFFCPNLLVQSKSHTALFKYENPLLCHNNVQPMPLPLPFSPLSVKRNKAIIRKWSHKLMACTKQILSYPVLFPSSVETRPWRDWERALPFLLYLIL